MIEFQNEQTIKVLPRGYGKSAWDQMVQSLNRPHVQTLGSALVDEKLWYTVKLTMPAAEWVRHQPQSDWYNHSTGRGVEVDCFDVVAELYTALRLKWS